MLGFKSSKCKTACKLCVSRIKLLRNKREIQLTQQRRQIGQLLQQGKNEYAWIRVEAVIREKNTLAAYEILELYLELISVRVELLAKHKSCPRDMVEAITTLMYAAPRVADLPELLEVRKWLSMKFGRELGVEGARAYDGQEPPAWQVNLRLRQYLGVEAPEAEDKLTMISSIAQETETKFNLEEYAQSVMVQMDPIVAPPIPTPMPYAVASNHVQSPYTQPYPQPYTQPYPQQYPPPGYAPPGNLTPTVLPPSPPRNHEPSMDGPILPKAQPSFRKPYQGPPQGPATTTQKTTGIPLDDDPECDIDPSAPKAPPQDQGQSYEDLQKRYDAVPGPVKKHDDDEEPLPPIEDEDSGEVPMDEDLSRRLSNLRKGL